MSSVFPKHAGTAACLFSNHFYDVCINGIKHTGRILLQYSLGSSFKHTTFPKPVCLMLVVDQILRMRSFVFRSVRQKAWRKQVCSEISSISCAVSSLSEVCR